MGGRPLWMYGFHVRITGNSAHYGGIGYSPIVPSKVRIHMCVSMQRLVPLSSRYACRVCFPGTLLAPTATRSRRILLVRRVLCLCVAVSSTRARSQH